MSKLVLEKSKLLGIAFGIFVLSQIGIVVIGAIIRANLPFTPLITAIVGAVFILMNTLLFYIAHKLKWFVWPQEGVKGKDILWILLSYPMIFLAASLGSYLVQLEGAITTVNQAAVQELYLLLPRIISFLTFVVGAPIGEELFFREAIPRFFSKSYRWLGLVFGVVLFTWLHQPTTFGSWVLYGSMSAVLAWIRHQTGKIEIAIGSHMIWNLISYLRLML